MSEEIETLRATLKATSAEMLKAIRCLYIAVESHVADDVSAKVAAHIDATTALVEMMRTSVKFWQKDSATAWDKCEERRKETVMLIELLKRVLADARISSADQVSDETKRDIRAALAGLKDNSP